MALKPLGVAPLPCELPGATITAVAVGPKTIDGKPDSEQKKNEKLVPLWTIDAFVTFTTGKAGTMTVTVPATQKPAVTGPVKLEGLRVGQWVSDSGRGGGLYWSASAVSPLKAGV
ncbi:MAG: hypothetical protein FWG15_08675 [Propionibacteriaceae bacterium]|nr:hypothetical protein [Propionibacteriaceae bacterium]